MAFMKIRSHSPIFAIISIFISFITILASLITIYSFLQKEVELAFHLFISIAFSILIFISFCYIAHYYKIYFEKIGIDGHGLKEKNLIFRFVFSLILKDIIKNIEVPIEKRRKAIVLLPQCQISKTPLFLIRTLEDQEHYPTGVRTCIASVLSEIRSQEVIGPLCKYLNDNDPQVIRAVAEGLTYFKGEIIAIQALKESLTRDKHLKDHITLKKLLEALREITEGEEYTYVEIMNEIESVILNSHDADIIEIAVGIIESINGSIGTKTLKNLLKSSRFPRNQNDFSEKDEQLYHIISSAYARLYQKELKYVL